MDDIKKISEMLSNFPLYKKLILDRKRQYVMYEGLKGYTFDFDCSICGGVKTFRLSTYESSPDRDEVQKYFYNSNDLEDKKISISNLYKGVCQSCQKYYMDMVLKVDELKKLREPSAFLYEGREKDIENGICIYKIGQYPIPTVKLNKDLKKYLPNKSDRVMYGNAINCLNQNYGIAAYSYFRIILQNNIVELTKSAIYSESLSDDIKENISSAFSHYNEKKARFKINRGYQAFAIKVNDAAKCKTSC